MKAYNLHGIGDLRYEECPLPELREGWCLVKVKSCGICSSDIPRVFTKGTYHFPTIPGHEFSGVVDKVASAENEKWLNKRVGIFPLIPCKECDQCKSGHYETCRNYDYIGSRRDGAYAEYVAVPVWNLIELPESVSFHEAAMLEPLSVALHAAKRADIQTGDSVAVLGTGMIGFAVAQWMKMLGAGKITVIGRSSEKRPIADSMNLNYIATKEEPIEEEFDDVVEAVGTPESVITALSVTASSGHVLLMGNPSGDIDLPQDVYWKILRRQLLVTGTWNSSYESGEPCDWTEAVDAIANKKVQVDALMTHCFPQEDLDKGLELMRNHKESYCKVMTDWNAKD